MVEWHILTGEYPPQSGGVSDYSQLIARGLANVGDEVHVWAPQHAGPSPSSSSSEAGIQVHRLPGCFGRPARASLEMALQRPSSNRRLLLQYVPFAFGWKGMNVPFCWWLYQRRKRQPIWVMFHEVIFPVSRTQPLRHNVLGLLTHLMAALVVRSAERCFVSTPAWIPILRRLGRRDSIDWVPVPSNLPVAVDPRAIASVRARYAPEPEQAVIGHFGTFGSLIAPLVEQVLPPVLASDARRVGLLLGRGSERLKSDLLQRHPALAGRLFATGELDPQGLADHLSACDLLLQPYPDGVSTRRGSLMAGLALGVPVATTLGSLTEPIWQQEQLVGLAPASSPGSLAAVAETLLTDSSIRRALAQRGQAGYRAHFQVDHCIRLFHEGR